MIVVYSDTTSNMNPRYEYYYNCIFPDNERGGLYLIPGQLWSFEPEEESDSSEMEPEEEPDDDLPPVESTRDTSPREVPERSLQITPDISADISIDELDKAFSLSHPNLGLPSKMNAWSPINLSMWIL